MTPTPTPDASLCTLALACIPGLGPTGARRLLALGLSPLDTLRKAAGGAERAERPARAECAGSDEGLGGTVAAEVSARADGALQRARALRERCAARGVDVIAVADPHYPAALRDLEDAPIALFTLGNHDCARPPTVAIVGSRNATSYGRHIARDFAHALAQRGVCVVSGLAAGIDAEAHAGALAGDGPTIAVQGTGVDVPYPRANTGLHAAIAKRGLVLSELPPGRRPHPGAFPRRNRLIAALADVIVVVEAGPTSGALITAQLGRALDRIVAAVPGAIGSLSSLGTNLLLRDGAHVITAFDDVASLLALTRRGREMIQRGVVVDTRNEGSTNPASPRLGGAAIRADADTPEGRLLAVLAHGPRFPDELLHACALSPRDVGIAISLLSLQEVVTIDPSGLVRRRDATLRPAHA